MSLRDDCAATPRPERSIGQRRVPALIGMPIVMLCGALGAAAGVLFPLQPAAVPQRVLAPAADAVLLKAEEPAADRARGAAQQHGETEARSPPSAAPAKFAAAETPASHPPQAAEQRQHARHRATERVGRTGRAHRASLRRRAVAGEPPPSAAKGPLSQVPIIGSVAGLLLP